MSGADLTRSRRRPKTSSPSRCRCPHQRWKSYSSSRTSCHTGQARRTRLDTSGDRQWRMRRRMVRRSVSHRLAAPHMSTSALRCAPALPCFKQATSASGSTRLHDGTFVYCLPCLSTACALDWSQVAYLMPRAHAKHLPTMRNHFYSTRRAETFNANCRAACARGTHRHRLRSGLTYRRAQLTSPAAKSPAKPPPSPPAGLQKRGGINLSGSNNLSSALSPPSSVTAPGSSAPEHERRPRSRYSEKRLPHEDPPADCNTAPACVQYSATLGGYSQKRPGSTKEDMRPAPSKRVAAASGARPPQLAHTALGVGQR